MVQPFPNLIFRIELRSICLAGPAPSRERTVGVVHRQTARPAALPVRTGSQHLARAPAHFHSYHLDIKTTFGNTMILT